MRHERTTQGESIYGRLVGAAQRSGQGQVSFAARLVLEAGNGGPELGAVGSDQRWAAEPDGLRGGAVQTARASAGVGLLAGGFDDPAGPEVGVAGRLGQALRSRFQRAHGRLDGAIVRRRVGR